MYQYHIKVSWWFLKLTIILLLTTGVSVSVHAGLSGSVTHRIAEVMTSNGFENVRVFLLRDTLVVEYENRVYFRERDAVAAITAEIMDSAPEIQTLIVVPRRDDVPLFQLTVSRDDYLASVGNSDFRNGLAASWKTKTVGHVSAGRKFNSSSGKVDIVLRPEFGSLLGRISDPFIYRFAISPSCSMSLGWGLKGHAQVRFLIHDEIRREKRRISLARLFLDYTYRHYTTIYANLAGGYFDGNRYGLSSDAFYFLWNDRLGIGGNMAWLGTMYYWDRTLYFTRPWRWTALANLYYSLSSRDLLCTIRFGKFLYQDRGVSAEITRFFRNTAITAFAASTDQDSIVGVGVQLLTYPRRHMVPRRARIRLPTILGMRYRHDENNAGIAFASGRDVDYITERFWLTDLLVISDE